jgi:hypothetical protein
MMAEFKIGATQVGMTNLESLATPIPLPQTDYLRFARTVTLGSGLTRGVGLPVATWTFQLLSIEEYNQLRQFCTGASAHVFLRTKIDDDTYDDLEGDLIWPNESQNRWYGGYRKNLVLTFRGLVAV